MSITIKHAKTANFPDWTQADIDKQIALGNLPAGTTPADMVLKSDWNHDHTVTGIDGVYVPYTGATTNVDLGSYDLKTNGRVTAAETTTSVSIGDVNAVTCTQGANGSGSLFAGAYSYAFDVYAGKSLGGGLYVWSSTPYRVEVTDNGNNTDYAWHFDISSVTGADIYKVVVVNDDFNGYYGGISFTITSPATTYDYDGSAVNIEAIITPASPYNITAAFLSLGDITTVGGDLNLNGRINVTGNDGSSGTIYTVFGGGSNAFNLNVAVDSNFTIQPHIGLSDGVAFASVNNSNSANLQMEFRASHFAFNCFGGSGLDINTPITSAVTITGGKLTTKASATGGAGFNLPSGTAPTSPSSGDMWFDGTNLKFRVGGTTKTVTLT